MTYPKVSTGSDPDATPPSPRAPTFPAIEERVLDYWEEDDTFQASVDAARRRRERRERVRLLRRPAVRQRAAALRPPAHRLRQGPRSRATRRCAARRVERRFGWDTHGLPAELEAMRQLGIKTTDEILELGIEKFNEACRESVMKYTGEWREYVTRQARWVDFDHDYRTMNPDYMESVIWAFKQLYDKGLVYEGFRVLPYCWNDETPLSNHELRMDDDVYQMRQDPAVTVGYDVTTPTRQRAEPAGRQAAGLDDDAVDAAVQPRGDGGRGHRLRRRGVRPHRPHRAVRRWPSRGWRRTPGSWPRTTARASRGSWGATPAPTWSGSPTRRRSPTTPATRTPSASSPPSSSPPPTAPGWCTPPAPSVRTTRSSPTARASRR